MAQDTPQSSPVAKSRPISLPLLAAQASGLGAISSFIEGRVKGISVDKGRSLFSEVRTIPVSFGLVF